MAIDSLSASVRALIDWQAADNLTGTDYSPTANNSQISKVQSLGTAAASNAAGGADELISYIVSISASSSTTLDLTSIANILGSTVALVRVKAVMLRLLSETDDSTNGTAAASVTIGNAASTVFAFLFDADDDTLTLRTGECLLWLTPSAAGLAVDSSNKSFKVANNDASLTAKLQLTIIGATA